jgi:hypothetical protein
MTMSTGEEELIISMERFASVLKDVSSHDMILAFRPNDSYPNAVASSENSPLLRPPITPAAALRN